MDHAIQIFINALLTGREYIRACMYVSIYAIIEEENCVKCYYKCVYLSIVDRIVQYLFNFDINYLSWVFGISIAILAAFKFYSTMCWK